MKCALDGQCLKSGIIYQFESLDPQLITKRFKIVIIQIAKCCANKRKTNDELGKIPEILSRINVSLSDRPLLTTNFGCGETTRSVFNKI